MQFTRIATFISKLKIAHISPSSWGQKASGAPRALCESRKAYIPKEKDVLAQLMSSSAPKALAQRYTDLSTGMLALAVAVAIPVADVIERGVQYDCEDVCRFYRGQHLETWLKY
jgi:hypothetical protein